MNSNYTVSIQKRTKQFAVRVIKACVEIEVKSNICRILASQLLRSASSIGANCSEAQSAQSRKDFIHKYEIALKEARETKYWIEVIVESGVFDEKKIKNLIQETEEIIKILVATVKKLKE